MDLDVLVRYMAKAGRDMWDLGWAEANAGNISLRLNKRQYLANTRGADAMVLPD